MKKSIKTLLKKIFCCSSETEDVIIDIIEDIIENQPDISANSNKI